MTMKRKVKRKTRPTPKTGTKPKERADKVSEETKTKKENVKVERSGDRIIIPEGMTYKDARTWIERQEVAEETVVQIADTIPCFPLDGIVALARAFDEKFGFTDMVARTGFWGMKAPPRMIQVPLFDGTFETAPLSRIQPPKWEDGFLEPYIMGPAVYISGNIKRKFEKEVKEIITITRRLLRDRSIYKGTAFQVDLHWWDNPEDEDKPFNPDTDRPKFMEATGADIILNHKTEFELETSVYMIVERAKACIANGIALKHGALFKGPFGTGKTLTAKVMAKKAVENGWTFIYLRHAGQLSAGLKLAKMYAPSIVFAEDVDTVASERDETMNELLNVLDGVDTKDSPIMVILTTNQADDIHPSFLRAGRIDTVIDFGLPEADTAMRFVKFYAGTLIKEGEDLTQVGKALKGLVPAFVKETVNKAKRAAIYRTGDSDITGKIVAQDLLDAAVSVREHLKMLEPKTTTKEEKVASAVHTINYYGQHRELPEAAVAD